MHEFYAIVLWFINLYCIYWKSDLTQSVDSSFQISVDDVEGIDTLRWDDQEKIRNYVGSAPATASSAAAISDKCTIEVAKSARTSCRRCGEKITKGAVCIF